MKAYLKSTEIIDWQHPEVLEKAKNLAQGKDRSQAIAQACFEWVRDRIRHSFDRKFVSHYFRSDVGRGVRTVA